MESHVAQLSKVYSQYQPSQNAFLQQTLWILKPHFQVSLGCISGYSSLEKKLKFLCLVMPGHEFHHHLNLFRDWKQTIKPSEKPTDFEDPAVMMCVPEQPDPGERKEAEENFDYLQNF